MRVPEFSQLPLVDRETLSHLEYQLDNPPVVKSFVLDFVQVWDRRYSRLSSAMDFSTSSAALDAILSIKSSSSMVGAARLAQLAAGFEDLIRAGKFPAATEMLPHLNSCALRTIQELLVNYTPESY